ncbi:DUF2690 domain-containing protein [Phytohabitans sp. LJ34]|uniref:DUF2690 domain-containing protein n=1 Tax=Phytohabitans sp. LJ34 TaxID=3452217 RepID=UPI003F8BC0D9
MVLTGVRRRAVAYLAMVVMIGAVAPVVAAPPALAQCYGCDGVNPQTNGCTGAEPVREFTAAKTGIRVELRFSGACGGAWTRHTQPGNARYGTTTFLQSNDGQIFYTHPIGHSSQEWTPMARWTRTLRACYGYGYEGPDWNDYDVFECTSWW